MRVLYKWIQFRRGRGMESEWPGVVLVALLVILIAWVGSNGRRPRG